MVVCRQIMCYTFPADESYKIETAVASITGLSGTTVILMCMDIKKCKPTTAPVALVL